MKAQTNTTKSAESAQNKAPAQTVQMTSEEWKAIPRDYKISRKSGRFVMRHSQHGIGLFPVQIVD